MTEPIFISLLELLWARLAATIASACASISGTLIVTVTSAIRGALIKPIDRFLFIARNPALVSLSAPRAVGGEGCYGKRVAQGSVPGRMPDIEQPVVHENRGRVS